MDDLSKQIEELKKHFYINNARKKVLEENKEKVKKTIEEVDEQIDTLEKVSLLFQKTAQYAREQGKTQIENLATRSLQYIFKKEYRFEIDLLERRGSSSADFFVVEENDNGYVKTNPELSKGGGIVDIVSLALRLSFMENASPKIQGPLILDEPAKHVSEDYVFDIGNFLLEFSNQMNRQIIMITHNPHLAELSNNTYVVDIEKGISKVEKIN